MGGITKGDRKMLIGLLVLLLGLIVYVYFSGQSKASVKSGEAQAYQVRDTIYIEAKNPSDTLQAEPKTTASSAPIRTARYPGPPERAHYPKKLEKGATIDLNSADTLLLTRVPGIGTSFARRIYKYRELLGGYYVVEQLQEVYGMDRERYEQIAPFFRIETAPSPLAISRDSIPRHPYLQWRHTKVLKKLLRSGQEPTWKALMESGQFSTDDSLRLAPYLPLKSGATH